MTDVAEIARGHSLDVCKCGDYRHSHTNGSGPCAFNTYSNGGHGGASMCFAFDMHRAHLTQEQPR